MYLKTSNVDPAKEMLVSVVNVNPNDSLAWQHLGFCYLRLKDTDRSVQAYERAIKIDRNDWEAHKGLGVAYALKASETKDDSYKLKAVDSWRKSLNIKPDQSTRERLIKYIEAYSK